MTDWHCHILPGIDDGPSTVEEALGMAEALHAAGFTNVHCTPHLITGCYEADNQTVLEELNALQERLNARRIPLCLLPGREYYLDEFFLKHLEKPLPLGDTKYLLVEVPAAASPDFVKETCYRIVLSGYLPMIAHPERSRHFDLPSAKPGFIDKVKKSCGLVRGYGTQTGGRSGLIDYLTDIGCLFQGNLGSFRGMYGERARKSAVALRSAGVYTHFGTDLHSSQHPVPTMTPQTRYY